MTCTGECHVGRALSRRVHVRTSGSGFDRARPQRRTSRLGSGTVSYRSQNYGIRPSALRALYGWCAVVVLDSRECYQIYPLLLIIIVIVFVVLSSAALVLRCRRRNVTYCRVSSVLPVVVHCIYIYDIEFSVCVRAVIGNCWFCCRI